MTAGADQPIECLTSVADLDDPRQPAKGLDPLEDLLRWWLCTVSRGAEGGVDVALEGPPRLACLCRVLLFRHRVPSHDPLSLVVAKRDAQPFQSCVIAWVERVTAAVRGGAYKGRFLTICSPCF